MPAPKGQPSNNPDGRPLKGKARRETLTARVEPETLAWLKSYAAENGCSLGEAVDDAKSTLKRWEEERG